MKASRARREAEAQLSAALAAKERVSTALSDACAKYLSASGLAQRTLGVEVEKLTRARRQVDDALAAAPRPIGEQSMTMLLENRLNDLRSQRVAWRRAIERTSWSNLGDAVERRRMVEHWQRCLRGSEREWEELHALLDTRLPGPPVSLTPTPAEVAALQRQRQAVRSAPPPRARNLNYVCKVIRPE
jgi:hypothetical protein